MSTPGAIVTFAVTWWLFFFMALPFGAQPSAEPVPGTVESAPARPRLWLKALVATVLAAATTWGLAWVIQSGLIQLRPGPTP
jgi:predicted secreted protein